MRTLGEIIELAKYGNMPTHEECYWAMLALDALHSMASMDMTRMVMDGQGPLRNPEYYYKEQFGRTKRAFDKSPKEWVGPNNDPSNPAYQKFRQAGKKLIDKVLDEEDNTK